jgi:Ca2+-binding EF-hand superfamily protein
MSAFGQAGLYTVPTQLATTFTPKEVSEFRKNFALFDRNSSGT